MPIAVARCSMADPALTDPALNIPAVIGIVLTGPSLTGHAWAHHALTGNALTGNAPQSHWPQVHRTPAAVGNLLTWLPHCQCSSGFRPFHCLADSSHWPSQNSLQPADQAVSPTARAASALPRHVARFAMPVHHGMITSSLSNAKHQARPMLQALHSKQHQHEQPPHCLPADTHHA